MSTNELNTTEDADMSECDGEKVVTMMDVLQEQQEFEEDANAVLGASDDKDCTYSKGYVKRQALYACLTCCSEAKDDPTKRAGVCLACSLNCHENHELVELYTKRNFCCDCGNLKFNSHPCQFTPKKTGLNEENSYNQNFSGVYCICHRPYPDPESTVEEEMIQCIICEDWLHATHLEATVPANDQYSEMICKACMEKNEFLHDYSDFAVNVENAEVDVTTTSNSQNIPNGTSEISDVLNEKGSEDITKMGQISEKMENSLNCDTLLGTENNETDKSKHESDDTQMQEKSENKTVLETDGTKEPLQNVESTNESNSDSTGKAMEEVMTNSNEEVLDSANTSEITKNKNDADLINNTVNLDYNKTDDQKETSEMDTTTSDLSTEQLANEKHSSELNLDIAEAETTGKEGKSDSSEICSNENIEESNNTFEHVIESNKKDETSNENIDEILTEVTAKKEQNETETSSETKVTNEDNNEIENDNIDLNPQKEENEVSNTIDSSSNQTAIDNKENADTNIEEGTPTDTEMKEEETSENGLSDKENTAPLDTEPVTKESKRKLPTEESNQDDDIAVKKPKLDDTNQCKRPKSTKKFKGATFWPSNFRQKLCTCSECISMYKDLAVLFLIDPEDTVTAYENLGKEKINGVPATQYEKGLEALSSLDRVQQINALTEYNKMRDKLLEFLKSFKDRKEIVKEEDIKAFFAGMKPKREPDGVYFCR